MRHILIGIMSFLLVGCMQEQAEEISASDLDLQMTTQALQVSASPQSGSFVALDTLATSGLSALPCDTSGLNVTVSVADKGSSKFTALSSNNFDFKCLDGSDMDLALVVDISKSMGYERDVYGPLLTKGIQAMVDGVKKNGARMSYSTFATRFTTAFGMSGVDGKVIAELQGSDFQGWTALLDGIRAANEILAETYFQETEATFATADSFCDSIRARAIVLYGDGEENDSDDNRGFTVSNDPATGLPSWTPTFSGGGYIGDGVLPQDGLLAVDNAITPVVYLKARQRDPAENKAMQLAQASGGRTVPLEDLSSITDVFATIADYSTGIHKLCISIPEQSCKDVTVRVDYSMTVDPPNGKGKKSVLKFSSDHDVSLPCKHSKVGKVANVLMKFNGAPANIPYNTLAESQQQSLIRNLVTWAVPHKNKPKVLLLNLTTKKFMDGDSNISADENLNGEAQFIEQTLSNCEVKSEVSPKGSVGLSADLLYGPAARDVIWLVGGRTLPDNYQLQRQLLEYVGKGGNVILSGDNVTWSYGGNFSMEPLTHLKHFDSGVRMGAFRIYSGPNIPPAQSAYEVAVPATGHPVTAGLEGSVFRYLDDIDTVLPSEGGQVLMTATVRTPKNHLAEGLSAKPVVIVYE